MTTAPDVASHFLLSGAIYCDQRGTEIHTVLGSCVSICLYDTRLNFGGMNHFLLPEWNSRELPGAKFGDVATEKLRAKMIALGSSHKDLVAKIFGGAGQMEEKAFFNVGRRNVDQAFKLLTRWNIPVITSHVGGKQGRQIIFHSGSGHVSLKVIETGLFKSSISI